MLEAKHHHPGCRPPSPTGPGQRPSVEEALGSEPRTVSRRYLSSLKNKLSSGAWRKSYQPGTQPGTQPGMGMQVPKGWSKSGELGWGWNVQETHLSSWMPGWMETAGLRWNAGMAGPLALSPYSLRASPLHVASPRSLFTRATKPPDAVV